MDNFKIDVTGETYNSLAKAIEIAFEQNAPGGKATHYSVVKLKPRIRYYANQPMDKLPSNVENRTDLVVHHFETLEKEPDGHLTLVLCWSENKGAAPLPFPLKINDAINFVKGWLENAGELGPQPDHDGDNKRGWRVFTETWGHVAGCSYSIVAVQAVWAMYGK